MISRAIRESLSHTPKALRLVWDTAPGMTVLLALLTSLGAVLPLGVIYFGKLIVDAVVAGNPDLTLRRVLYELALIALQALVLRSLGVLREIMASRLTLETNLLILKKAQAFELKHFEDSEFYDQLTRARREASARSTSVVNDTFLLGQNGLTLVTYIALLSKYNLWAVVGLFLAALPATLTEMYFSTASFRLRQRRSAETRKLYYFEYLLSNDSHVKEVKLFNLGPSLMERYRSIGEKIYQEDKALGLRRSGWTFTLSLVGTLAFYGCYAVMAMDASAGNLSLGNLMLYMGAFRQGQQGFLSILTGLGGMYENNLYLSNLFNFLALPTNEETPAPAPRAPSPRRHDSNRGIRFENVGFRYPGSAGWALEEIDFFIPEGQSLAIVGNNGAGKTTFIKLLTRLYEPTRGRIVLDGRDLFEWDRKELRDRISVVFQDFNRYQLSVRDNVAMGNVEFSKDEIRLERAIKNGGASELLSALPKGLDSPLGRWFHQGTELSGGQWQKIALARACLREESDILVLDEPTAALDAETEFAIFERFRALTQGRTTILISHRFPTVRMADKIILIEKGRILESGSHDELVSLAGRYAHLFSLQADGYL